MSGGAPYKRSNEAIGRQRSVGKPTEVVREQPLPAAQAGTGYYMQPAGRPSHTHTNHHTERVTRSKTKQLAKRVHFNLAYNKYFEI